MDKSGSQYVIPVQAKGGSDRLNRVQIEQDIAVCGEKMLSLVCRPVGAQHLKDDLIALLESEQQGDEIRVASENHYRLVHPDDVTEEDLAAYRRRS